MKSIKFGNKKALQIISNEMKESIRDSITDICDIEISARNYNFLNENNIHYLKNKPYKVCLNTFGQKYLLYLTKYDNKKYCIFINRKRQDMIYIRFRFSAELFTNTLFDGELIKNSEGEWIYAITDILSYQGENIKETKTLNERLDILNDIMENK